MLWSVFSAILLLNPLEAAEEDDDVRAGKDDKVIAQIRLTKEKICLHPCGMKVRMSGSKMNV